MPSMMDPILVLGDFRASYGVVPNNFNFGDRFSLTAVGSIAVAPGGNYNLQVYSLFATGGFALIPGQFYGQNQTGFGGYGIASAAITYSPHG